MTSTLVLHLSQHEREVLTLDEQIDLVSERLGFHFHDLTEDEKLQVRNNLGLYRFYCAECRTPGWALDQEEEWRCAEHR